MGNLKDYAAITREYTDKLKTIMPEATVIVATIIPVGDEIESNISIDGKGKHVAMMIHGILKDMPEMAIELLALQIQEDEDVE